MTWKLLCFLVVDEPLLLSLTAAKGSTGETVVVHLPGANLPRKTGTAQGLLQQEGDSARVTTVHEGAGVIPLGRSSTPATHLQHPQLMFRLVLNRSSDYPGTHLTNTLWLRITKHGSESGKTSDGVEIPGHVDV